MGKYDVLICVGWKDCFVVKKTIQYIRKNLEADKIYLIMSSHYFKYYKSKFLAEYNVILLNEDEIIPNVTYKSLYSYIGGSITGWYFQQFLKFGFAASNYVHDKYLIWDADTLPLSKIKFEKNGKLLFTQKKEFHKPYFDTIKKLLGYDKKNDFSYIAEHMIIKTNIMKELLAKIISNIPGKEPWPFKILKCVNNVSKQGFSEFETYGTYIENIHPNLYDYQKLTCWRSAGFIFGRYITENEIDNLAFDLDIISLESQNGKIFPRYIYTKIQEIYLKTDRFIYMKHQNIKLEKFFFRYVLNLCFKKKGKIECEN